MRTIVQICVLVIFCGWISTTKGQTGDKPNFLFIIIDDMNDYIDPITNDMPQVSTPNIQQLADSGTLFLNAFANAPGCAPSRTSMLSGKDLKYTQVYNNELYENNFRGNFTAEKGNQFVVTLPQALKDSGGYYTLAINKVFHNPDNNDYDKTDNEECEKIKSWNRMIYHDPLDSPAIVNPIIEAYGFDGYYPWGPIPDSLEYILTDHITADTAIYFLQNFLTRPDSTCGRPFFLAMGIKYPHSDRLVPESYFPPYYLGSIYDEPFVKPYNDPVGTYPYNGIVMPPQPVPMYQDYYNLPTNGVAQSFVDYGSFVNDIFSYYDSLDVIPEIEPGLDDSTRRAIIEESLKADFLLAYLAAIQYADYQIGRVVQAIYADTALANNTVIVLTSDHGYSLGEKRHWDKWCMWETDLRVPMIIVDPSKPAGQTVDKAVSLLDLYPTICDLAGVNYPVFDDGSRYLDGNSLLGLLDNPSAMFERPALTSYRKNSGLSSCNPTFSVRNERFHYISYRKNNGGGYPLSYCDSTYFGAEEELYEIGVHRETDPYEWYNLINDPDYQPVVQFLQQFFPDSNLYMQNTYKAIIENEPVDCFLAYDDTLFLSFDWYDTSGNEAIPSPDLNYSWTNNLTADVFEGTEIEFPVALIGDDLFTSENRIMMYLQVYDTSNQIVAFDTKYFYLNPAHAPMVSFNAVLDSTETVTITDFDITGSYNSYWWDYGEGPIITNSIPGPFTYEVVGPHELTLYVQYGNDCVMSESTDFTTVHIETPNPGAMTLQPNPADQSLIVKFPDGVHPASVRIFDISGRMIWQSENGEEEMKEMSISTAAFTPGFYVLQLSAEKSSFNSSFIVVH